MNAQDEALKAAFEALAAALAAGGVAAYRAMAVKDAPLQEAVFQRNAEKVRAGRWTLKLRTLALTGEVGDALFDLLDANGKKLDEGKATFTLEAGVWKLRAL